MRRTPEQVLQRAVCELLELSLGGVAWYTHFPAGGGGKLRGQILKGLGLKAGVPDVLIVDAGHAYWIELKSKRGRVSQIQRTTQNDLCRAGCSVAVIKSVDELLPLLRLWGVALKPWAALEPAA